MELSIHKDDSRESHKQRTPRHPSPSHSVHVAKILEDTRTTMTLQRVSGLTNYWRFGSEEMALDVAESLRTFYRENLQNELRKSAITNDGSLDPVFKLLQKKEEVAEAQHSLKEHKEKFRVTRKELRKRREELQEKKRHFQERCHSFDEFFKKNEEMRQRALQRASKERELIDQMELHLADLQNKTASLQKVKMRLEQHVEKHSIYLKYLEAVVLASRKFQTVNEVIEKYTSLAAIRNELLQEAEQNQRELEWARGQLESDKEKKSIIMDLKNELVQLQKELGQARANVQQWETQWARVQNSAASRTLMLGTIRMATLNMYRTICREANVPKNISVPADDTLAQLDTYYSRPCSSIPQEAHTTSTIPQSWWSRIFKSMDHINGVCSPMEMFEEDTDQSTSSSRRRWSHSLDEIQPIPACLIGSIEKVNKKMADPGLKLHRYCRPVGTTDEKPKLVELQHYPGFSETEPTSLPTGVHIDEVIERVVAAQTRPKKKKPNEETAKKLFSRTSENYVNLLVLCRSFTHGDVFLKGFAYTLSQALYCCFCHCFPQSWRQFCSKDFLFHLCDISFQWTTGIHPSPGVINGWNLQALEPASVLKERMLPGSDTSRRKPGECFT
ncbi:CC42M protein, partial [Polypterus senegalus]